MESGPERIEELPDAIPIFPLTGALLLPRAQLPLQMFEPRYLAMTEDAMATDRLIGMIQPRRKETLDAEDHPDIYGTGCLGLISEFSETPDRRYLVTLTGLCRFDIVEELPSLRGYRRTRARYDRYAGDLAGESKVAIDRDGFMSALRGFLEAKGVSADWDAVAALSDDQLVSTLTMLVPFAPNEKQALLESADLAARAQMMTALFDMSRIEESGAGGAQPH